MVGQQQPESDAIGSTVRLAGAVTRARVLAVALELARLRGLDLDHPSGLSKVISPR